MIGMSFAPFITLLILGFLAALVIHVLAGYYVLAGLDGHVCVDSSVDWRMAGLTCC
jgi:hypothetical protein